MRTEDKRIAAAIGTIAGVLVLSVCIALFGREGSTARWVTAVEGFLAVATPCCTEVSLWGALDGTSSDGQRPRPATLVEAAQWLDAWPYRLRKGGDALDEAAITVAVQSSEIRCRGRQPGGEILRYEGDEPALEAIRQRRGCEVNKWKVWSEDSAHGRQNERHTVWVDDDGHFHGRVDYWRP